jgi:hypothetical protein
MQMAPETEYQLPVWAPRLRKSQIEKLYNSCAKGLMDEELIDDVGFSLYARCLSTLEVSEAVRGRPKCPKCEAIMKRTWKPDEVLRCSNCHWQCPWKIYQKTYQRKNLNAGGMEVFIKEFVRKFRNTRSHSARLVLIDTLIHRYHWEGSGKSGGRPGACGLIQGKMKNIMPFLDRLNYGDQIPEEINQTREEWRQKWSDNPWSKGKGQ